MDNDIPLSYIVISRLLSSNVLEPLNSYEEISKKLIGIQSQIHNASSIAYAIRLKNGSHMQYLMALQTMKLLKIWGIRTTLHTYITDDCRLIRSQLLASENWFQKKMKKNGVDLEKLVNKALAIIDDQEIFDRGYLIQHGISQDYLGPWGDLLIELSNRGYISHYVSESKKEKSFINLKYCSSNNLNNYDWNDIKVKQEIVRRYFKTYGPATKYDFSHWLKCSISEADACISLINSEICKLTIEGKEFLIIKEEKEHLDREFQKYLSINPYILLPKFDPLLLAYNDKSWIVKENHQKHIWKAAGHVEGVLIVNWKAVGTWKYVINPKKVDFNFNFFETNQEIDYSALFQKCQEISCYFSREVGDINI